MFPKINNKDLFDCDEADFRVLLDNPDYRESLYLEYKECFSFFKAQSDNKASGIIEFRNDICSFANAEGGYLIYGVSEKCGIAKDLIGIEVDDDEKFELNVRNKLSSIMPKAPSIKFSFPPLSNGRHLVIIFVEHDYYLPYIHIEDEKNYKIYKRNGCQKMVIGYMELKNMFIQSRVLEDEIRSFREKRIDFIKQNYISDTNMFMLFHIIPESFLNDRKDLFVIEKRNHKHFGDVFSETGVSKISIPCVDGLRYVSEFGDERAVLYNNGIAEFLLPLNTYVVIKEGELFFFSDDIWEYIDHVSKGYQAKIPDVFGKQRYFGCVCIVGCKDVISEDNGYSKPKTIIDRNEIVCQPIVFAEIENMESFNHALEKLKLEYLLSIGVRGEMVTELISNDPSFSKDF